MNSKLVLDVSNLSIHKYKFVRTGIQEVQYRTLLSAIELRNDFPSVDLTLLPFLPRTLEGHGPLMPYFSTPPDVLESIEEDLRLPSHEVWGFNLKKHDYNLSDVQAFGVLEEKDHLHIQSLYDVGSMMAALSAKSSQKPGLSITLYDLVPFLFPEYCDRSLSNWFSSSYLPSVAKYADHAICISRHTALDVASCPVTRLISKISDLSLPFDQPSENTSWPHLLEELKLKPRSYFVYLGSIEPRKNVDKVIEGFERFALTTNKDGPRLLLVGSTGWKNASIEKIIRASPVKDCIVRAGYLEDEDLDSVIRQSAGLIMISQYEGYGLPVAQAFARGVPVVTTLGSSMPEACAGQGIFVEPFDPCSVAVGLKLALAQSARGPHLAPGIQDRTWLNYTRLLLQTALDSKKQSSVDAITAV